MSPADAEDLHGDLWLRLLANGGRLLRRFRGTASIETYLTTVATNLAIDRRRRTAGKWRPTARALREEGGAVELEMLVARDGLSPDVAVAHLLRERPVADKAALERIAHSIVRKPRRSEVGPEMLVDRESPAPSPIQLLAEAEAARSAASIRNALHAALNSLPSVDRKMLIWRYADQHTVADIAKLLCLDQKALYRRFDRLCAHLKARLAAYGVEAATVLEILAAGCDFGAAQIGGALPSFSAAPVSRAHARRLSGRQWDGDASAASSRRPTGCGQASAVL